MLRTPTVFEAAVKTICTTNVAWSATVRMVNALVDNLGEQAASGARAFPTAEAMASVPESFYRETVRAGYRSAYLHALASGVVAGVFEVEGRKLGQQTVRDLTAAVRQILNLEEDLSEFYLLVADDPDLSWAAAGAGRMLRTPTVFEAAVKTICTLVRTAGRAAGLPRRGT